MEQLLSNQFSDKLQSYLVVFDSEDAWNPDVNVWWSLFPQTMYDLLYFSVNRKEGNVFRLIADNQSGDFTINVNLVVTHSLNIKVRFTFIYEIEQDKPIIGKPNFFDFPTFTEIDILIATINDKYNELIENEFSPPEWMKASF